MDVSFSGYQNVGGCSTIERKADGAKTIAHKLIVQLNNVGVKDLDVFESILKKYPDRVRNNFLTIDVLRSKNPQTKKITKLYYINKQQVPVDDENLGIFSKIHKLVTRINQDESKFEIRSDYKKSKDFNILATAGGTVDSKVLDVISGVFHDRDNTKEAASNICKSIDSTMRHYFSNSKY